eukprot:COSAG02_NODE_2616_length_8412_cov_4.396969_3_plen_74_part_00
MRLGVRCIREMRGGWECDVVASTERRSSGIECEVGSQLAPQLPGVHSVAAALGFHSTAAALSDAVASAFDFTA